MSRDTILVSIASLSVAVQTLAVLYGIRGGMELSQTPPVIRSTTRAVSISAVVTDRNGQPVQGLTKDDFQIFDDGQAQQIAFFATGQDISAAKTAAKPGLPGSVLDLALTRSFEIAISPALLDELTEKLRVKFQVQPKDIRLIRERIEPPCPSSFPYTPRSAEPRLAQRSVDSSANAAYVHPGLGWEPLPRHRSPPQQRSLE